MSESYSFPLSGRCRAVKQKPHISLVAKNAVLGSILGTGASPGALNSSPGELSPPFCVPGRMALQWWDRACTRWSKSDWRLPGPRANTTTCTSLPVVTMVHCRGLAVCRRVIKPAVHPRQAQRVSPTVSPNCEDRDAFPGSVNAFSQ